MNEDRKYLTVALLNESLGLLFFLQMISTNNHQGLPVGQALPYIFFTYIFKTDIGKSQDLSRRGLYGEVTRTFSQLVAEPGLEPRPPTLGLSFPFLMLCCVILT